MLRVTGYTVTELQVTGLQVVSSFAFQVVTCCAFQACPTDLTHLGIEIFLAGQAGYKVTSCYKLRVSGGYMLRACPTDQFGFDPKQDFVGLAGFRLARLT